MKTKWCQDTECISEGQDVALMFLCAFANFRSQKVLQQSSVCAHVWVFVRVHMSVFPIVLPSEVLKQELRNPMDIICNIGQSFIVIHQLWKEL